MDHRPIDINARDRRGWVGGPYPVKALPSRTLSLMASSGRTRVRRRLRQKVDALRWQPL